MGNVLMNNQLISKCMDKKVPIPHTPYPIPHTLLPILFFLLFVSCGKEEPRATVPFAHVHFRIDLNGLDHSLRNPLSYKVFTAPRVQTDRVGYGGLLIVSGFSGEIFAFDLACPFERNQNVRVVPTADGTAVCPVCKSVFDTSFGLGTVRSGVARVPLQRYVVRQQNEGVFLILNW
jgi:nitrite reductase/ring-hydroxylating ferredoxin subunit